MVLCGRRKRLTVFVQGIGDGLGSFLADSIASEFECVECLCEKASMVSEGEMVTVRRWIRWFSHRAVSVVISTSASRRHIHSRVCRALRLLLVKFRVMRRE